VAPNSPYFRELCLCGYLPQDLLERPAFSLERNHTELKELAAKIPLPSVVGYAGRVKMERGSPSPTKRRSFAARRGFRAKQDAPSYV